MITNKQWKLFKDCDGSYEPLFRSGSKKEKALMEGFDWALMSDLTWDLHMHYNGLLSDEYSQRVLERLDALVCEPGVKEDIILYSQL